MRTPLLFLALATILTTSASFAQDKPLKARPDAFAPQEQTIESKAVAMASTVDEMAQWDRYPTYQTYLDMMKGFADEFPNLCHIDTIGTSVQGRLILCARIQHHDSYQNPHPEFFYSSTMHGDEVTGYVMMLRLIDTLLHGYGSNQQYTDLINTVDIYINPLSNPDGTYRGGNSTVRYAQRYNANYVDLNRNYPDPFGTAPLNSQQQENTAMIDYVSSHHFRLSANLHGGSEVMNYPWDSFTSAENPHPDSEWWQAVCKRFVDTSRTYNNSIFRDVNTAGYIAGGDWYVIPNGRQDYMNYYHNCREMTMEISSNKTVDSGQLPGYWQSLQHALVNYIAEIHNLPSSTEAVETPRMNASLRCFPNPTRDRLFLSEESASDIFIFNTMGKCVLHLPKGTRAIDLHTLPHGIYMVRCGSHAAKVVKQ